MTGYVRMHVPEDLGEEPAPALVAIHGYGQPPAEMLAYAIDVAPPGTIVVAPEGPQAFYRRPRTPGGAAKGGVAYGWIADPRRDAAERRNDRLIAAAIDTARERHALDAERLLLVGYSQGAGVATHFAVEMPELVAGVVGLAGGVPMAWRTRLRALANTPVLWVSGTRDESYPPDYVGPLRTAFTDAGVPLEAVDLDEPHALLDAARARVRSWLSGRIAAGD
jgi:phospholipase/carboxylesterase